MSIYTGALVYECGVYEENDLQEVADGRVPARGLGPDRLLGEEDLPEEIAVLRGYERGLD